MKTTILLLVGLVACTASPTDPTGDIFFGRRALAAPASYVGWYTEVEGCLGVPGEFGAISWHVADSIRTAPGVTHVGIVELPHDITMAANYVGVEWATKVQMIYHVLQVDDGRGGLSTGLLCY